MNPTRIYFGKTSGANPADTVDALITGTNDFFLRVINAFLIPALLGALCYCLASFTKKATLSALSPLDGLFDGGFRFSLTGEFGMQYRIDASTNLVEWELFTTFTNTYGRAQFTDSRGTNKVIGTNGTFRFYRALSIP